MPHFVREHVRLREIAGRSELPVQLGEESEIEIDLAIGGTVERPGHRLGEAAPRLSRVPEQYGTRLLVAVAEQLPPCVLRVIHDGVHHVDQALFLGRGGDAAARCANGPGWRGTPAATTEKRQKVHSCEPAQQKEEQQATYAEAANAHTRHAAPVFDVAAVSWRPS